MNIELVAVAVALLFLAAALFTVWLGTRFLERGNASVLIAVMVIPTVVYLVVSGRISEFSGPGGVQAKFQAAADAPVQLISQGVDALVEPVQGVTRDSAQQAKMVLAKLDRLAPVVMTIKLGQAYEPAAWRAYADGLIEFPSFHFAVLLDEFDRFLAFMTAASLRRLLDDTPRADKLVRLIAANASDAILEFPGVETVAASPATTAVSALRDMRDRRLDFLLVVGDEGKVVGIIDQQDVLSQIILDLVGRPDEARS